MGYLKKRSQIQQETLSSEHYFQSLLEQAYANRLLSACAVEQIQRDCFALLAKLTERFNGGASDSIRVEKAQNILESILFSVGVCLKTYETPDAALDALAQNGIEALFAQGQKQIDRLLKQSKMRHMALCGRLLPTPNVFYTATIVDGIKGFFKLYRPEFAAQEIHITADYPVYNKAPQLLGVSFIAQYLEQLYHENAFCMHFPVESIHHLLCGYDAHYENLLFNLYEPVLTASLGCVLSGLPVEHLDITCEAQAALTQRMSGKGKAEIEHILAAALEEVNRKFSFSNSLRAYIEQSLPQLAGTIASASQAGTLHSLWIIPQYPEDNPKLLVSYGQQMADAAYSKVVDEFMKCQSITDKIHLMQDQIHSLADLNDLLLDTEPGAEEIALLLKARSPAEIAALISKYRFAYEMDAAELRTAEKELYEGLQQFTASLNPGQRSILEQAVKAVEID